MAIGYRCHYPEEQVAWKALDFEYEELGNWTTLSDLMAFLGRPVQDTGENYRPATWKIALAEFRHRYGDAEGIWVCDDRKVARSPYGVHPLGSRKSDESEMLEVQYDPENVIVDLGYDGKFVLKPKSVTETRGNPRRNPPTAHLVETDGLLGPGDRDFLIDRLMPYFGIKALCIKFDTESKKVWPDLWCEPGNPPSITVTWEWAKQNENERRKRLTHEAIHLGWGKDHDESIGYSTKPNRDRYSMKVYHQIIARPRRKARVIGR